MLTLLTRVISIFRKHPAAAWLVTLLIVAPAVVSLRGQQQQNTPHAGYVYPAGGRQGSTVQVSVGGQFLDGVAGVLVSGTGVQARVVDFNKPLTGQALNDLRDKMQALQKQPADPAVQRQLVAIREQLADSLKRNAAPVLSERVTIEITIAPNAEPGARQLRLNTPLGVTSPLVFVVGQLPEFRENDVKVNPADMELAITLPAIVNGRLIPGEADRARFPARLPPQYMPGDVDRYRFPARKGQQLVAVVSARDLMPYLADAVPGWFQATLTLFDAKGHELAYDDDYRSHPDPVIHYQIPADGEYVLEIKDAIYRGREDFVYRIAIGELPFATSIFPLGGRAGTSTAVEVAGWNLPATRLTMDAKGKEPGVYPVSLQTEDLVSNRLPFAVDTLPEVFEKEPNNSPKNAQPVTLPIIVNGRIQQPGDWDEFRFKGRAGDAIVAEVTAHRLESPLDSVLELTDVTGHRIAWNDDFEDKSAGLETHHADSLLSATLPATGTYFVRLGDIQHKGGPEYAYRLRISAPRPDFDLRISPSSINAGGGGTVPVAVTALRKDGFSGDIALALKDAPGGFTLSGGLVPAGQDQVRLTLTVPPAATNAPISVKLEGRATIAGQTVVRQALPADDMMQAFAYRHLVPADDLRVFVSGRGGTRVPARLATAQPVKIPAGGSAQVRMTLPPAYATFEKIECQLSEPPEGLTLRDLVVVQAGASFVLQADAAKIKPGLRGNLIVTMSGERVPPANQPAPAARRRVVLGTLPAIAFEIVK
jgi:hypothetical protein